MEFPELREYDTERFWQKVKVGADDECWPWQGASSGSGYGRFKIAGKLYSPHRVAYRIVKGELPDRGDYHGTEVMHSCDFRLCCNPSHLTAGTHRQNVRDMDAKGRRNVSYTIRIDIETIRAVRLDTRVYREIAEAHGISESYVGAIKRGLCRGRDL